MKQYLCFLSLLMIGLISAAPAVAQGQNGNNSNFTVEKENIAIKVTGNQNVPKFEFWEPGNNDSVYRIQFNNFFEIVDSNDNNQYDTGDSKVPGSNNALASWSWTFGDVEDDGNGSKFDLVGSSGNGPQVNFVNYLGGNASSFKFDVNVDNYNFVSSEDQAMLVLAFKLTSAGGNDADAEESNSDRVQFDDAFFEIKETAQTNDGDIAVGLSTPNNGSMAYIAYERFNGSFSHDPVIGLDSGLSTRNLILIGGGVVVVVLIIAVIIWYRRK